MSLTPRTRKAGIAAGAAVFALTLAACSGGGDSDPSSSDSASDDAMSDEPITLTISTFNDFGYTQELLDEYTELHPNVTIEANVAATSNDARTNYFAKLGAGGLADVEAIEVDWMPEVMEYADLLADLTSADVDGRWLDWKTEAATDSEGRLVAYGTDIGPEAVCYNATLFEEAGLPTDPAEVAALLEGDWDTYFSVGQDYVDATGGAWFDSAGAIYQGVINQVAAAYEDPDTGELIAADNAEVADAFTMVTDASAGLSAHLSQWSDDWYAALANEDFATMLCPGWMLGVIQGAAPDSTGWNVADVFPGGGGNWGGSYLTVPADGENVDAAIEFAAWLTAPEQQLKALANAGTFPSQNSALEDETALNDAFASGDSPTKAEFFNTDSLGTIFSNRANAITVSPFKGSSYFDVNDIIQNALTRTEDGSQDPTTSWDQALSEIAALG
ncbi:ABC transporter substrate-binding protein [Demequina sp. NBRC 110054]|uniref:ABC transporter substrate-binding protein n=1 Tax=Demequina sp. NBRC 110054 TaxID=1570343 RepID=UPI0009FEFDAD|nr:extracellular solute-binding protein [Demequina sp. NBRC 110054]